MIAVPASRYVVFVIVAMGGLMVDLATKAWLFTRLGMPGLRPPEWIVPGVFGFQTSLNEGALFGMGQGMALVFAGLSTLAALAIVYWLFFLGVARDAWMTVALGSIEAGILGNLYDRLGLPGLRWHLPYNQHQVGDPVYAVRDWILVMIGRYEWPTFNIADSMLVCGACLLVLHAFLMKPNVAAGSAT